MSLRSYHDFVEKKRREFGDKFSTGSLAAQFIPYYESGQWIKVKTAGATITGWVSATTGWRPVFLLMRRQSSIGSMWTLGERDKILAVKRGKKYVPVKED